MLSAHPSNRLEFLADQLVHLYKVSPPTQCLSPEWVVVQNPGMAHWLSMALATRQGLAFNMRFEQPSSFMWTMVRKLNGDVPKKSPYRRETLLWRIYERLDTVADDPAFAEPTAYWRTHRDPQKRYQLSRELADLYEQYLLYRPDWIQAWEQPGHRRASHWQAKLWQLIQFDTVAHPLTHLLRTAEQLKQAPELAKRLPHRVVLFGINNLAPLQLGFLTRLAEWVDVHLFLLSPSDEYWGDLLSHEQQIRARARWLRSQGSDGENLGLAGNPLLVSLGRQGQEFTKQLYAAEPLDIPAFEPIQPTSLLQALQHDLLTLHDRRQAPTAHSADGSIHVSICHSRLREIQVLHDWLLARFNDQPGLRHRDIVVMCPAIEDYAPYIEAVFKLGEPNASGETPQLACSIADRSLHDAEPLVQSFLRLLDLPDSRFKLSEVLAQLNQEAVQRRWQLSSDDVERIGHWCQQVAVHWGLNPDHRHSLALPDHDRFTWEQGLKRLLLGYLLGDQTQLADDVLTYPALSAEDAALLGTLMQFIDSLARQRRALQEDKTAAQWLLTLNTLLDTFYQAEDNEARVLNHIRQAIHQWGEATADAAFEGKLPCTLVREHLQQHFREPQQDQQFLTGRITFCSMLPMRSLPFRIICMLGMNDGEYPRQRPPLGFDLIAAEPRLGDRSRRDDDRYLLLEALLSARDALYFSYIGRSQKDNSPLQPSLLLSDITDYLCQGFDLSAQPGAGLFHETPLQPFSRHNFDHPAASFDGRWLHLLQQAPYRPELPQQPRDISELALNDWASALVHPPRHYARARLEYSPNLPAEPVADDEPFASHLLDRYRYQTDWVQACISGTATDQVRLFAEKSGQLPYTVTLAETLDDWGDEADAFAEQLHALGLAQAQPQQIHHTLATIAVHGNIHLHQGAVCGWRLADAKAKDQVALWLAQLLGQVTGHVNAAGHWLGRDGHFQVALSRQPEQDLAALLALFHQADRAPFFTSARVALELLSCKEERRAQHLQHLWQGHQFVPGVATGLAHEPYYHAFWQQPPALEQILNAQVVAAYQPLLDAWEAAP